MFIEEDLGVKCILEKFFAIENSVPLKTTDVVRSEDGTQVIRATRMNLRFQEVRVSRLDQQIDEIRTHADNKELCKIIDAPLPTNFRRELSTLQVSVICNVVAEFTKHSDAECLIPTSDPPQIYEVKDIVLADIPLMVGSSRCLTSKLTKEQLINVNEDPNDPGGYFIAKGQEWSIDSTESIKFNELEAIYDPKKLEVRAFVMSKPGDTFENSVETTITYQERSGRITLCIESERYKEFQIPFYAIFKLLGITDDREMIEMICLEPVTSNSPQNTYIKHILKQAIEAQYEWFNDEKALNTQEEYVRALVDVLQHEKIKGAKSSKYLADYLIFNEKTAMDALHEEMFPHIGQTHLESYAKLRYLGELLNRVLIMLKNNSFVDINAYQDKRIHSTGENFAKEFKKHINSQIITRLRFELIAHLEKVPGFDADTFREVVQQVLEKSKKSNNTLQKLIVAGEDANAEKEGMSNLRDKNKRNKIMSEIIVRKNPLGTIAQMREINNQKQSADKGSKKKIEERSIQPEYAGFICIVEAVETSEKAGKLKTIASLAEITRPILYTTIYKQIKHIVEPVLYPVAEVRPENVESEYSNFYINGFWIGYVKTSGIGKLQEDLKSFRRSNPSIWKYVTIYRNQYNDLTIYSDYGRMVYPLVIVHTGKDGKPFLKFDEQIAKRIHQNTITVDELLELQVIEYLSIEELQNCAVSHSFQKFYEDVEEWREYSSRDGNGIPFQQTHVFLPISMLGIVGLLCPFANFEETERVTMFTNEARESCGWATLNFPYRMDKQLFVQYYTAEPLVKTIANDTFAPNGQNIIVAYTLFDGSNEDDSIIFNKDSADRGLFRCVEFTYEDTEEGYKQYIDERIETEKLHKGVIKKGIWVSRNDVLVVKKEKTGDTNQKERDVSLIYEKDEPAYVLDVINLINDKTTSYKRVMLMTIRNLSNGDKMSARSGCKSVISSMKPACQMPYTADGLVPDVIFNVHSLVKRMLSSELYEGAAARIAAETGRMFDATVFNPFNPDGAGELLKKLGVEDQGYEYLYHPRTGEMIKSQIYVTPTFYERLERFAVACQYSVADSTKDALTRQAIGGRKLQGGMKLGEMDSDGLFSHGSLSVWEEKFLQHSDGCVLYYCVTCKRPAQYNANSSIQTYKCDGCNPPDAKSGHPGTEIVEYNGSWTANLFNHTLNAMNVDITYEFEEQMEEIDEATAIERGIL